MNQHARDIWIARGESLAVTYQWWSTTRWRKASLCAGLAAAVGGGFYLHGSVPVTGAEPGYSLSAEVRSAYGFALIRDHDHNGDAAGHSAAFASIKTD